MKTIAEDVYSQPISESIPFRPRFIAIWDVINGNCGQFLAWNDFRSLWRQVPERSRDSLLRYLYDKFCTFGYVGLHHPDGFIENPLGQLLLSNCLNLTIDEWTDQTLALASMFWLFESAAILLTEYNRQLLEVGSIERFLLGKRKQYSSLSGLSDPPEDGGVLSLCKQIGTLRASIPSYYIRCFSINGKTWEREERYLDTRQTGEIVYPVVCREIKNHLGVALPPGQTSRQRFEALVDLLVANGVNPFEVLVAIANAAVTDSVLEADYAVVTVPQGRRLDTPWDLQIQDICSYATVRPDFDPVMEGVEFQRHQIIRAIERRMRFNTSCRSKNYHPVREVRRKAQPFQFPDIAFDESTHHLGHIKTGIRNSARTHFEIRIPSLIEQGEFRGFGDFRINRADDSPARHYSFDELSHLLPYGEWCKTTFDYAIGNNLFMDPKYCTSP